MGKLGTILTAAALVPIITVGATAQDRLLLVASTTSVEDSGLFDHIIPQFTASSGITIRIVSRASATALMTAERGTIDLVIVNDPNALDRFAAAGEGTRRLRFMYNQFVIVGPVSDPANIKDMREAAAALREIARLRAPFVSRGDNSGTHMAEQRLWQSARVNPKARSGTWYRETGLGMGLTVQMAARLNAYTLTDRATWLRVGESAASRILVHGDPQLFNPYEIVLVSQASHPHVNVAAGNAFIDWLVSDAGKAAIASHRINGEQLFMPSPGPTD
jgi:tungstate transport system substrate-binding protein